MSARLALALLFSLVPVPASAQAPTVLVLPWSVDDEDGTTLAAHAERVAGAIPSGDASAISVSDARARFEEHGSSEPRSMSDGDLDRWLALSRQAVRQLAHADYAGAASTLLEAQALSEPAAAELNREETRARQVLDTCLYDVRALVETNDPRAEARALECRRLVPRIAPSPYQHTPEVVALMTRIDRRLASAPPGSLRLESMPPACRVRLNGIPLGETPFVSEDLATGEYRAQIECGDEATAQHGRVHRIRLGEGSSTVQIDVRFDSVVRTDTALRLVYATAEDAEAHRVEDAVTAAVTIGAREVWLVSSAPSDADVVRIVRIDVASASVLGSTRASSLELPGAVAGLFGTTPVAAAEREVSELSPELAPRADWEIYAGIGLGALGVGAYVTSFTLIGIEQGYGHLATQPLVTDPDYLSRRQAWTSWEAPALALGWTGGLLGAAAVSLAMANERDVPWWGWTIGGVGVATVAVGIALALGAPTCGASGTPTMQCTDGTALADTGSTIASLGAPLIAVPVALLIRSGVGADALDVVPSASVTDTSASVSVGGVW